MGVPYRYGGSDRNGVDCSGLVLRVYQAVAGVALPHQAAQQYQYGRPIPAASIRPGDLVFFRESGKGVFHVGISLGGKRFVHASTRQGVIVSSLEDPWYGERFCGAKRLVP